MTNMQVHELSPFHKLKKKKRIGRGGKRGTYSGRGLKGQKSRAGAKIKPMEREFILRIPKKRGLGFPRKIKNIPEVTLSLDDIVKHFNDNDVISPKTLMKKGIVDKIYGRVPRVKIVGGKISSLEKKLIIKGCKCSRSVKDIIEKTGGKVQL
jgi:large subunit ribosomal protein L15